MQDHSQENDRIKTDNNAPQALCFGEILFDRIDDQLHLGGAPLNFAYYLAQYRVHVGMVSAVGEDDLGDRALQMIRKAEIDDRWIARVGYPTGIVEVSLSNGQPSYDIVENVAWDNIPVPSQIDGELFYFGTLAQRTRTNCETAYNLSHHNFNHVFLDVNLRQRYYSPSIIVSSLSLATFVKMSDEEWPVISGIAGVSTVAELLSRYEIAGAAITKGDKGAELVAGGNITRNTGYAAEVIDAVGAGDAFSAVMAAALIQNVPLEHALDTACRVGAYVVNHSGAQVILPDELKRF